MSDITATPALTQAWAEYHATLEEMRLKMEASSRFQTTPQHRAKAYHTLMEMQAMAYNFVVAPRLLHPRIYVNCGWQTEMYTLGQNGQDFYYGVSCVDGAQTYRLRGRMGDVTLFLLQTMNGIFGEPGAKVDGNYDWADFHVEPDGTFEVILSAEKQPGNWVRLDPTIGYQFMLIRRALPNWEGDPGDLVLERISPLPGDYYDADEFDETAMAARIHRAALFLRYVTSEFNLLLYDLYARNAGNRKNAMTLIPGTGSTQVGSPSCNYAMAVFDLKDDEALLIEMDTLPNGAYWSFQLGDVWSRSLDFTSRQSSLNDREALPDGDGKLRIVVSQRDPGVANWLDPCGRIEGTVVFRNYRATTPDVPNSRVVAFGELGNVLPQDTRRVSTEERKRTMDKRRAAMRKLYRE